MLIRVTTIWLLVSSFSPAALCEVVSGQPSTTPISDSSAALAINQSPASAVWSEEAPTIGHTATAAADNMGDGSTVGTAPRRELASRMSYPPLQNKIPAATRGVNYDRTCIFTIVAPNGFGFVDALFQSASISNPSITCRVWVVADRSQPLPRSINEVAKALMIQVVTITDLQQHSKFMIDDLAMKYNQAEFATALKPIAFTHLFQSMGVEKAIFLDIDMWVLGPLTDVVVLLDQHTIVLCSPVARPVPPERRQQEDMNEQKSGIMNLGFVALSNSRRVLKFLSWWYNNNRYYGALDSIGSTHFDQNWGHHVLSFFDTNEFYMIKDPRLNNIHYTGTDIYVQDERVYVGEERMLLLQVSAVSIFDQFDVSAVVGSGYRHSLADFMHLDDVLQKYTERVKSADIGSYLRLPYGFNIFDDGTAIPDLLRQYYRELADKMGLVHPVLGSTVDSRRYFQSLRIKPFQIGSRLTNNGALLLGSSTGEMSYIDFLLGGPYVHIIDSSPDRYFCELESLVRRQREDVRNAFPDPMGENYAGFKSWFSDYENIKYLQLGKPILELWRARYLKSQMISNTNVAKQNEFGISVVGWVNGVFGVGVSAYMMYGNLKAAGAPVKAINLYGAHVHKFVDGRVPAEDLTRSTVNPVNIFVVNAANILEVKGYYPEREWKSHFNIAVWAWELDKFPDYWMHHLAELDMVWTSSKFIKEAIMGNSLYQKYKTPVSVIPFGLREVTWEDKRDEAQVTLANRHTISRGTFLFLVVFDYYSVFDRKNPLAAIRAFREAFPEKDGSPDVALFIKTSPIFPIFKREHSDMLKAIGDDSRIYVVSQALPDSEMDLLRGRANCYVSLHRSEGYGLNVMESMVAKKPTIATDYSGNADFFECSQAVRDAHFPISYTLVLVSSIYDYQPYGDIPGARWADPDHEEAVQAMRKAAAGVSPELLDKAADALRRCFGPEVMGEIMVDEIKKHHKPPVQVGFPNGRVKERPQREKHLREQRRPEGGGGGPKVNKGFLDPDLLVVGE